MSDTLMIDNWTLQDVERLLSEGLGGDSVGELAIDGDRRTHSFGPVPEGAVRIDALLTLLTNVVCFERLLIDTRFVHTWQRNGGHLSPLDHLGVVIAKDYATEGEHLPALREAILEELCVTPSLQASMQEIRQAWTESRTEIDPHLSALVWGGAGMLARSQMSSAPYFGHPARRRLLQETRFFAYRPSAGEKVTAFVDTERARMFRFRGRQMGGSVGHVLLPPIAVQVIEESDCLEQLIPTAVNLRDKHRVLREWLREYQTAIDEEDERRQLKYERTLHTVSKALQAQYGAAESEKMGISLSAAFFKLDLPRSLLDRVRNSFGVRAALSKLVLSPRGHNAMTKLLNMFGEATTTHGRSVLSALQKRYRVSENSTVA